LGLHFNSTFGRNLGQTIRWKFGALSPKKLNNVSNVMTTFLISLQIFGFGIGLQAILTLLIPWLGTTVTIMIVIRVLQGLVGGVTYSCAQNIWFYWAPIPERSRMTSIAYTGMDLGTIIAMPASAYLATSFGWQSIFYVFGLLLNISEIGLLLTVTTTT